MSNYDKPLDQVVKDQKKAKFQAKKKQAGKAALKAKIGKGGKKPVGGRNNQVAKNRNFGNKPVGRNNNANRNGKPQGRNNVARNSAPMKKQLIRKNVNQARNNNRAPQRANIPRAGLRSASAMAKSGGIMTGLKVHIDNLDWGVTEKDMRELFGEFGGLKTVQMHFDSKGKSQGVCDIHFKNRTDGLRAVKKYNNVPLDGRRMKIDVVGQPGLPVVTKVQAAKQFVKQKLAPNKKFSPAKKQQMNKKPVGKKLVGKAKNSPSPKKKILLKKGGKAGKPGQKKETRKPVSEEDLDKQLDAYLAAARIRLVDGRKLIKK